MKRFILLGFAAVAAVGVLAGTAAGGDPRGPVGNTPFTDTTHCAFPVNVVPVSDNEYHTSQTTLPDGTLIQKINGKLFESFTNTNTGKTITENLGGPGTFTTYPSPTVNPTVSFLEDATGHNLLAVGPISSANTGHPIGLFVTTGHLVAAADWSGAWASITLTGNETDLCALLAP